MTIIVLEGPDGSGKTTLAKKLVKQMTKLQPTKYLHDIFNINQWAYSTRLLIKAIELHKKNHFVVLDRAWIGDNIYGRIYRGTGGVWVRRHDSLLRRFGALYVFCLPPKKSVLEEHAKKHAKGLEMYNTVDKIYDAYLDLWNGNILTRLDADIQNITYAEQISKFGGWQCRDDGLLYDWTKDTTILPILQKLDARSLTESMSYHNACGKNISGLLSNYNTTLMLSGYHSKTAPSRQYPMFKNRGSCGMFTFCVHATGKQESKLAYMDVSTEEGLTQAKTILSHYHGINVICLGLKTTEACLVNGIEVSHAVRHPRHVVDMNAYIARLKEAFGA